MNTRESARRREGWPTPTLYVFVLFLAVVDLSIAFCPQRQYLSELSVVPVAGSGSRGMQDGAGSQAEFRHPEGVAPSLDGKTVFVADRYNDRIRAVDLATKSVTTFAGGAGRGHVDGPTRYAQFYHPLDLTFLNPHQLVVADSLNHRLRLIDLQLRRVSTLAGTGDKGFDDGLAAEATFNHPSSVAALPDGSAVVVADTINFRIRVVWMEGYWDAGFDGPFVTTLAGGGARTIPDKGDLDGVGSDARFGYPRGLAVTPDGRAVVVADAENHKIRMISIATGLVETLSGSGIKGYADGSAEGSQFRWPFAVDVHPSGQAAIVADTDNHRIRMVSLKTGHTTTLVGKASEVGSPRGVAVMADGRSMVVAGSERHVVYRTTVLLCEQCSNSSIPAHAEYSAVASGGECGWECSEGHYESKGACRSCTDDARPLLPGGHCPTGFRVNTGRECGEVDEAIACLECAWRACEAVGTFRSNCSDERPEGECAECTRKPVQARFSSAGTPGLADDCRWECLVGHFVAYEDGSLLDHDHGAGVEHGRARQETCVPCTDKPEHAVFTTNGVIRTRDSCQWECLPNLLPAHNQTRCWPFLAVLLTLHTTRTAVAMAPHDEVVQALALAALVPAEHVQIVSSEGTAADTLLVEARVIVAPERLEQAHAELGAGGAHLNLLHATVIHLQLRPLPQDPAAFPAALNASQSPGAEGQVFPVAVVVTAGGAAVMCATCSWIAVLWLRRRRKKLEAELTPPAAKGSEAARTAKVGPSAPAEECRSRRSEDCSLTTTVKRDFLQPPEPEDLRLMFEDSADTQTCEDGRQDFRV